MSNPEESTRPTVARESEFFVPGGRQSRPPGERPSVPPPGERISSPDVGRGRDYETLEGASGREVFFRPRRYSPKDFEGIEPVIEVTHAGVTHPCELQDVSQNGVAFVWPVSTHVSVGDAIERLAVSFDQHTVYRGAAQVTTVRELDGRVVVGASFSESLMNIDDVMHLRDVRLWSEGEAQLLLARSRPWFVEGHERFKSLVAELRLFFEDSDARLSALEARLPSHLLTGEMHTAARNALIDQLRRDFVPEFVRYSEAIDAALRSVPEAEQAPLKDYSLRMLHDYFMRAPFMHRCRTKPLGYPGDYEVMRYIYERQFEGATLFGRALHLAVVWTRGAHAVRCRKDVVRARLDAMLDNPTVTGRPIRIASVAAGPAQEIVELLAQRHRPTPPVEFLLFDQDPLALSYAQGRMSRHIANNPSVKVVFLHDSIKRLLHDPTLFKGFGPFDMIFCAGLFDYLRFPTAVNLCRNFYDNLNPGGMAFVGNMVQENPCKWFLEHHLEWFLLLRTREEMMAYASAAAPEAEVAILEDGTGINPFVTMRKP
ncbi:MAG: hypothetical protein EPO40_04955 [Myxococcaceae bacterium]|nr:MAG: hypothetical protein EPO40_04955 [Myxococcaceae bacterium]